MGKSHKEQPIPRLCQEPKKAKISSANRNEQLRKIPKIDKIMETELVKELEKQYGHERVRTAVRESVELLRQEISGSEALEGFGKWAEASSVAYTEYILRNTKKKLFREEQKRMQRVINATGVILHTNLGRAPLGERLVSELVPLMTGYTNLELNLEDGKRGSRYDHFAENLCRLTGAEAAIVVNNNAAAVLVMLTALASGGETIVSRGELVEIGGKFRIPDVCRQSGTTLVEAGTTNRTYLQDYENAVTENTVAFLKVHTSNYQITGFTHEPELSELSEAAHSREFPLLVDFGSGSIVDMAEYGIQPEKTVQELLEKGADIVTFSGDKLLGGPQAGILVGRKDLIEKISRHPLMRALRIDKYTAAALDKTVGIYLDDRKLEEEIPVYEMMGRKFGNLEIYAPAFLKKLTRCNPEYNFMITSTRNPIGGGTTPGKTLPGAALLIKSKKKNGPSAQEISNRLRQMEVPIIGHIVDDWVYLELRTLLSDDFEIMEKELIYDL